ncbi:MAG: hypothetical protein RMI91_05010, partial [Gemmatales bacterium]|nr:hypothetical protein [Gemmatales bacterium]
MLSWWRHWGWGKSRVTPPRNRGAQRQVRRVRSHRRAPARTTLRVEQLEDRTTPTNNIPLHPVNWTNLGPVVINPVDGTQGPWAGPVSSIAASGSTWYAATMGGGIWKSTNAGATWTPLTDFLVQNLYTTPGAAPLNNVSLAFGTIVVSPTNPNFVMVEHRSLRDLATRFGYSGNI